MDRIQIQQTKLLCHCNKVAKILPQSFVSGVPFELIQHPEDPNSDDTILCDAIFSIESTCNLDFLQTKLQFQNRVLEFEVRSAKSINPSNNFSVNNNSSNNNNVSSSTHKLIKSFPKDLKQFHTIDAASFDGEFSQCSTKNDDTIATSSSAVATLAIKQESLDSTSSEALKNPSNKSLINNSPLYSTSHPSTMLRIRVRVTNFGVCIIPFMMINYTCSYRFKL
jgi:hypothetical protein